MKPVGETWIENEVDHQADRDTESNPLDLTVQIKHEQDDPEGQNATLEINVEADDSHVTPDIIKNTCGSMFLTFPIEDSYLYCQKCKLKYEGDCPEHGPFIYVDNVEETTSGQGSTKSFGSQDSAVAYMDRKVAGKEKLEQPRLCEDEEMHTCTKCYLIFFKLDDLQAHEREIHSVQNLTPGMPDHIPDIPPDSKKIKRRKITKKGNKVAELKGTTNVSEVMSQRTSSKSRKTDDKVSVGLVSCPDKAADVSEGQKVNCVRLRDDNCSKESNKVLPIDSKKFKHSEVTASHKSQNKLQNRWVKTHKGGNSSACDVCGAEVCQCTGLETDERLTDDKKLFEYDDCGVEIDEFVDLKSQTELSNEEKPFKCRFCGVAFTRDGHLQSHQRIHTGEKPYKCDICGVNFAQLNNLRRHKRVHTAEYPYKCDVCGVAFAESSNLKRHKRIHTGEKLYKCEVCGVSFTECSNLKRHRRTHTKEKPFKCDVCGVGFAVGCSLKTHMRVHTGEKPYSCDVCGAGFAQSSNLKKHKWTHAPEKPFKCDVCGGGFSDRSALKTHQRKHTGEKPYKCGSCDMGFADAGSFHRHKVLHTGVKPYKCDICGAAFTDNSNLKRHLRIHARETAKEV